MRVLGIETSCDETAAAVVVDGRELLSQTIASQIETHTKFGGVVPEIASRQHVQAVTRVVLQTLSEANLTFTDLDAIAVTQGPGLLGALLVGVSAAKGFALATGLPLLGVHHIAGHVAASFVGTSLQPPFLSLVVSGGHTELLTVDEHFCFQTLGATKDDAAGEAYDKVARLLGLAYPGGPKLDVLAATGNPTAYHFPRSVLGEGSLDFSYSGLKSAVANVLARQRREGREVCVADVAASFQTAVVEVLVDKATMALQQTGLSTLVLAGGVAANQGLRQALHQQSQKLGFQLVVPAVELCTDNGAMIAAAGYWLYKAGRFSNLELNATASLPLVTWQTGMGVDNDEGLLVEKVELGRISPL
ncbi:tRNA (adenosine(37)-N6)-threonylcarbamoyltransferase complex transferase subunit TsaD [Alicyclobacillaceae bacterium I2511]|nr:tRNA (adenosine(37)-N6)-threonylcarbamoyltransferase complex transferase subunit TsaD [Alicyclobacillaceae bacterium I2511]